MKSKLQIMTGHNSRSLSSAFCSIVARTLLEFPSLSLSAGVALRTVACGCLARMPVFNAHSNLRVCTRNGRCNMPWTVKWRDLAGPRTKKHRSNPVKHCRQRGGRDRVENRTHAETLSQVKIHSRFATASFCMENSTKSFYP